MAMTKRLQNLLAAVICLALAFFNQATAAVGDAFPAFNVLCTAWDAVANKQLKPWDEDGAAEALTDIYNMNMSIASDKWQKTFDGKAQEQTWEQLHQENTAKYKGIDLADRWEHWKKQRKETKEKDSSWQKKNQRTQTAAEASQTRPIILAIAEEAAQLQLKLKPPKKADSKDLITAINDKLKAARCSTPLTDAGDGKPCNEPTASTSKTATCTTATAGSSIGRDMLCLCSVVAGTDKCTSNGVGDAEPNSGSNFRPDAFQHIAGQCPKTNAHEDLGVTIDRALAMLHGALGTQHVGNGKMILGTTGDGTCTGTDRSCVDYHEKYTAKKAGLAGIPWVAELQQARALYNDYLKEVAAAEQTRQQIFKLAQEAKREYNRPAARQNSPGSSPLLHPGEPPRNAAAEQNKCKTKNTTVEECPEAHCDYNKEKEECKLKTGTENKAAVIGDRAAGDGAATGCAVNFRYIEKCEKMSEGKEKPVCARKKEGEGDKDKYELKCRNDCSIVNKEFALMATAFVSLVVL
ncbi:Trypanosomal VSG domain/Trypanosome variant surface glycoprotein C-terminal domain containing protein, putative [Trypanosoma equiperdum]|uniref:Trypanosomal VSG domain/Trypanosome variant surface glycoprotein C-terminal domain containing protein, putative n=1 Tax=Trypanosoma equiperdum TaxID=5694 RepID=A0A1G4I2Y5_TRYEQ|nr:Trypanosomal VSG domain/Trypanosome variant surface glycoprotein C-terminal domain containing protein, putative [Trypanosoma equiperdum]